MVTLVQLWLPILLSTVFVFFASSLFNMLLQFWHAPDYLKLPNEDEVGAAIRKSGAGAGMYMLPHCTPEAMKNPQTQEKFKLGPVGMLVLRRSGAMSMGASLGQWLAFCLVVAVLCALLATQALTANAQHFQIFHVIGLAAFMGHALGSVPNAIWWGHTWRSAIKYMVDGLVYALITAATFEWLWPRG